MASKTRPLHVMIDLETLSTRSNAAILTMAAVPFDASLNDPSWTWYSRIAHTRLDAAFFHREQEAIQWWGKQNEEVRKEAFGGIENLHESLQALTKTLKDAKEAAGATRIEVWSYGGNFDIPILEHAYQIFDLHPAWSYKYVRCYRTLKAVLSSRVPEPARDESKKHGALEDALHQARHAAMCLQYLHLTGVPYE